jgi:ribosomal protein S5
MHGKHNSCHAYIKATPKSREMVASEFASQILTKFGISSASVKLVGRRDPYAMVRAIFNALEQHENIDEFAKERGKRFLTLKFAYEKNV